MSELLHLLQKLGDGEHDDVSVAHDALTEIVDLRMKLAGVIKDAERYQYVRACGWELIGEDRGDGPEWLDCEEVDALCDKALAGQGGEG